MVTPTQPPPHSLPPGGLVLREEGIHGPVDKSRSKATRCQESPFFQAFEAGVTPIDQKTDNAEPKATKNPTKLPASEAGDQLPSRDDQHPQRQQARDDHEKQEMAAANQRPTSTDEDELERVGRLQLWLDEERDELHEAQDALMEEEEDAEEDDFQGNVLG